MNRKEIIGYVFWDSVLLIISLFITYSRNNTIEIYEIIYLICFLILGNIIGSKITIKKGSFKEDKQ